MSSDEIWNDPNRPKQQYLATLTHVDNGSNLGSPFDCEAATDDEAWGFAYQWAEDWCRKAHMKARLTLTGGNINGTRSKVVDPLNP